MRSEEELQALHTLFEEQRIERTKAKLGAMGGSIPEMEPDDYCDWLVRRGICPHAITSLNSKYHFETCVLLDGDMGLRLPGNESIGDTPSIFFQALNVVRATRASIREEEKQTNG